MSKRLAQNKLQNKSKGGILSNQSNEKGTLQSEVKERVEAIEKQMINKMFESSSNENFKLPKVEPLKTKTAGNKIRSAHANDKEEK